MRALLPGAEAPGNHHAPSGRKTILLFASARLKQVLAAVVTDAAVVEKMKATGVRNLDERIKSLK